MQVCTRCGNSGPDCESFPVVCSYITTWRSNSQPDNKYLEKRLRPNEEKWMISLCPSCLTKEYADLLARERKDCIEVLAFSLLGLLLIPIVWGLANNDHPDRYARAALNMIHFAAAIGLFLAVPVGVAGIGGLLANLLRRYCIASNGVVPKRCKKGVFTHVAESIREDLENEVQPAVHGNYKLPQSESNGGFVTPSGGCAQMLCGGDSFHLAESEWVIVPDGEFWKDERVLGERFRAKPLSVLRSLTTHRVAFKLIRSSDINITPDELRYLLTMTGGEEDTAWHLLQGSIERDGKRMIRWNQILTTLNLIICTLILLNAAPWLFVLILLLFMAMLCVTGSSMLRYNYYKEALSGLTNVSWTRSFVISMMACWITYIASVTLFFYFGGFG